jgi:high-affinity K+ transport system ATPase subunit B
MNDIIGGKNKTNKEEKRTIVQKLLAHYGIENIKKPFLFIIFYVTTIMFASLFIKTSVFGSEKFLSYKLIITIMCFCIIFFIFKNEKDEK